nr:hypothetical protein Iba_chr11bCG14090 [Ipomoea batatas]
MLGIGAASPCRSDEDKDCHVVIFCSGVDEEHSFLDLCIREGRGGREKPGNDGFELIVAARELVELKQNHTYFNGKASSKSSKLPRAPSFAELCTSAPSPSASPPAADSSLFLPIDEEDDEEPPPSTFSTMASPRRPPTEDSGDLCIGIRVIPATNSGDTARRSSELFAPNAIGIYKAQHIGKLLYEALVSVSFTKFLAAFQEVFEVSLSDLMDHTMGKMMAQQQTMSMIKNTWFQVTQSLIHEGTGFSDNNGSLFSAARFR